MENFEHLTEDRHFEIRQKIQTGLIMDFYGLDDPKKVSNEQAYAWIKSRSNIFGTIFSNIINEYPSFWDDAEQNFESTLELVKQKIIGEESRLKKSELKTEQPS